MSIEVQQQIRNNSSDIASYRQDLCRWSEELEKAETRRERRLGKEPSTASSASTKDHAPSANEACATAALEAMASAAGVKSKTREDVQQSDSAQEAIARDRQPMHQYYSAWDQFDVDGELERLDDEATERQRAEFRARQSVKDQILDDLALTADGDRSRSSKARPRVKVAVRQSGRRASPVDLAEPRKLEANGYFAEGRYREAVATYSAALDLLEKYEPPSSTRAGDGAGEDASGDFASQKVDDGAGDESEALKLKMTLLANRAAALLKLEEWRLVIEDCSEALKFDAGHAKAVLRRGFAYARQKRWSLAVSDLQLALTWDASDRKAAAELQMARRMLQEQADVARERAQHIIADSTRAPSMPTRRLNVRLQRACDGNRLAFERDPIASSSTSITSPPPATTAGCDDCTAGASLSASTASVNAAATVEKKRYVPKSVRMRGQCVTPLQMAARDEERELLSRSSASVSDSRQDAASGKPAAAAAPMMNFYTFEAMWTQHRGKPERQLALLKRIGASSLPALFRESLDSELLVSIVQALTTSLSSGVRDCSAAFVLEILAALARTARFDLSCQALSQGERRSCLDLLERIALEGPISGETLQELKHAYGGSSSTAEDEAFDRSHREEPAATREAELPTAGVGNAMSEPVDCLSLDTCD